ncbi:ATP-binding protein [Flavobacterium restrictum]|uniref:histidine kinase n=1 Tax=Flavobacterium restrictum TaxID=2594428 RepID=A0A553EDR7_9FLAO|nr:ATP-binding protein [Flavobacterium restrictum]TRX43122.1 PAS domain S-box protein [Flavobacterium restrictum]
MSPSKKSENTNYKSDDLFFDMFENSAIGMIITVIDTEKFQFVNKAFLKSMGFTRNEIIGKTSAETGIVIPEFHKKTILQLFQKDKVNTIEIVLNNKKGEPFWFLASIQAIQFQGKKCSLTSFIDISKSKKNAEELSNANQKLSFQNNEKEKRANELLIANEELEYQNTIKEKRAAELVVANKELAFQNDEKEKRAAELVIANKELLFQRGEKQNRADELDIANIELAHQQTEKQNRADELDIANIELAHQQSEKSNRADELDIANIELAHQQTEKQNRADELDIANIELAHQQAEKSNRALELGIANIELAHQQSEKQNRVDELKIATIELNFQKNLAQQQAYSRSLIEASRDPLFTISPQGKITDVNKASVRVTGVSQNDLIGSDFIGYFTDPEKAKDGYETIFNEGFVIDFPLTIKDHKLTDVLFNGSVYKDQNNTVIGAVAVARDITLQKALEKELTEAKVFAEHATSIAERATIVANESVKSKQQFLSNMSHEIRTPMNAIIGFTKVVLKTELSAKQKEYLTAIKMSGDALIVLINDILDLAKVDAGKMTFEKTPFKLKLSIKAMLHLFETKIQEKNLQLITNYDASIPEVLVGDPVRLHQIILNLVSNAVKFTNRGKITVSVLLVTENEHKATVKFSVADTGIGIKNTKIEKVFENFQQATSGTSRLFGGTGLGLAIVKQLVEAQNGKIEVASEENKGSVFSFSLDFKKTNADAVLEPEILELNTDIKDIKILVAEDMELNQLLMKTLLDDFGFECEIAGNGKIAIEKLLTKTYDIILMDLQMPEMNGFDATKYIRKILKMDIPIIALTADVTTVDVEKCKEVGMNDYISKPVDERLLYSKLISVIKKPVLIIEEKRKGNTIIEKMKYVDMSYLLKLTKSNPKLMTEMIRVYLKQTPPLVRTMKQSFLDKDWHLLQATIHKMLPSFTIMGINPEIAAVAHKIQEFAHKLEISDDLDQLVDQIENVCNQTFIELEIELTNLNK